MPDDQEQQESWEDTLAEDEREADDDYEAFIRATDTPSEPEEPDPLAGAREDLATHRRMVESQLAQWEATRQEGGPVSPGFLGRGDTLNAELARIADFEADLSNIGPLNEIQAALKEATEAYADLDERLKGTKSFAMVDVLLDKKSAVRKELATLTAYQRIHEEIQRNAGSARDRTAKLEQRAAFLEEQATAQQERARARSELEGTMRTAGMSEARISELLDGPALARSKPEPIDYVAEKAAFAEMVRDRKQESAPQQADVADAEVNVT